MLHRVANGALQAASRSQDATEEDPAGVVSPEEGAWLSLLALLLAHAGDARLIRDGDTTKPDCLYVSRASCNVSIILCEYGIH